MEQLDDEDYLFKMKFVVEEIINEFFFESLQELDLFELMHAQHNVDQTFIRQLW